ncbi:MAG: putative transporter ATP-binding protein [Myxococcales bacterium]|nr:putative transporter ATP-binding protein [Myxococcales bacterium]
MTASFIEAELDKRFGVREVLRRARIEVAAGTVHALVGENGAGKSTLVKILAGVLRADAGTLSVAGKVASVARWDRTAARAAGLGIVQQHGAFAGTLSVVENAVLGVEPRRMISVGGLRFRGPVLDLETTADELRALGERIGLAIDPWARAGELSLGAAQRAEIVAELHHGAKFLILDEPTAVLTPIEVDGLLATLRKLADEGTTIVFVTHKLDEVRAVADAVTVLRGGETVATFTKRDGLDVGAIARAMVGADLPAPAQVAAPAESAPRVLALQGVGIGRDLREIDLEVRAGEIVGVAGVDGNGQRELALAIAGLALHRGRIQIGERDVTAWSPARRLATGLAHIPEDRQHGGLVLDASVADNLSLGRTDITGRFRIARGKVTRFAAVRIAELDIRPPDPEAIVRALSGGNQQKVVIGRELSRPNLRVVVASQPTRGVDLGAVVRIHDRLRATAIAGAGVLVISADLDELLALCHRVVVLLRGRIVGERGGPALRDPGVRAILGTLMTGAEAA